MRYPAAAVKLLALFSLLIERKKSPANLKSAIPGSSFYSEPVNYLIRLNFAKRLETLEAAGERLLNLNTGV